MKLVYENKKLIGSFVSGAFKEVPPEKEAPKHATRNDAIQYIVHLVIEHNIERIHDFDKALRYYRYYEQKMKDIIVESTVKAMLNYRPAFPQLRYNIPNNLDVKFQSPTCDTMSFDSFELNVSVLEAMLGDAIRMRMEEEFMPFPNKVIFGKCLDKAVARGRLPKRFKTRACGFELHYDFNLDGIAFL